jgi:hypothetical protein
LGKLTVETIFLLGHHLCVVHILFKIIYIFNIFNLSLHMIKDKKNYNFPQNTRVMSVWAIVVL